MTTENQKLLTPRSLGYSMPAEWAPHRATWMSWPHNNETWPTQLETVRAAWVEMIHALSLREQVCLLVNDDRTRHDVMTRLENARAAVELVSIFDVPTVDVWMRDYGPTFITRNNPDAPLAFNDWIFNGWGGKYRAYEQDDQIAKALASVLGVPVFDHRVVLEGGSIDVNGSGTCLTTEQCLLNKNRNPHKSRSEIEELLKSSLGVNHVIWLEEGIAGDDTDGHIDDLARFVNATTVACVLESNPKDENYAVLQKNYERLQGATDQDGVKLSIVRLPCPAPIFCAGSRLPASYANFYIANDLVLVPTFNDPKDSEALGVLQDLFPNRKVVGIRCEAVVAGLGAIHCVTQQEPRISDFRT
jgi:agmatine deiminase